MIFELFTVRLESLYLNALIDLITILMNFHSHHLKYVDYRYLFFNSLSA
jgi:hypothetical protein